MSGTGYRIAYRPQAIEDLKSLPKSVREAIVKAIHSRLGVNPLGLGKHLRYSLGGHKRLRVGDYRIIYSVHENTVLIEAAGHRKSIYE